MHFNSRPHKEVDKPPLFFILKPSLFQLTTSQGGRQWGSIEKMITFIISTHDLTRRSTKVCIASLVFGSFQLTTSQGGRRRGCPSSGRETYFNSRPHKEVDRLHTSAKRLRSYFNSRPHKEVDGSAEGVKPDGVTFQLTTSQGGRPLRYNHLNNQSYFNSRPHKEVDIFPLQVYNSVFNISTHDLTRRSTISLSYKSFIVLISTHDLTRRSTIKRNCSIERHLYFNSRPHKEVDTTSPVSMLV